MLWLNPYLKQKATADCAGEGQEHFHNLPGLRAAGTPVDKWGFCYTGNKAVIDMYKGIGTLQNLSFLGCRVPAVNSQKVNFCSACSGFTALKQCPAVRIWSWSLAHPGCRRHQTNATPEVCCAFCSTLSLTGSSASAPGRDGSTSVLLQAIRKGLCWIL